MVAADAEQTRPQVRPERLLNLLRQVKIHLSYEISLSECVGPGTGVVEWIADARLYVIRPDSEPWWVDGEDVAPIDSLKGLLEVPELRVDDYPVPGGAPGLTVARFEGWIVEPYRTENLLYQTFATDYAPYLKAIYALVDEEIHTETCGDQVVLFNYVELAPGWRGLGGVGRLLSGLVLQNLGHSPFAVLSRPYPLQYEASSDELDFVRNRRKVRQLCEDIGFRHWENGVYFLDPGWAALDLAVHDLSVSLFDEPDPRYVDFPRGR